MAHGFEGIARTALAEFKLGNLELRLRDDRLSEHGQTVISRSVETLALVRHLRGWHEDDSVESVVDERVFGCTQMAKMHRIETSAEVTDIHERMR